jgi:rRNA-processing protein FCF1
MTKNEKNASTVNNSSCADTFTHETGAQPISPVLVDCLQKMHDIFYSVSKFYDDNPAIKECLIHDLTEIEDSLSTAAHHITQMAASEMLDRAYYQTNQKSA